MTAPEMVQGQQPPPVQRLIRLGLVGLGWGKQVASAAQGMEGVRICACHARTKENGLSFAEQWGCTYFDTYEEMLADETLNGVLIMTPNSQHRDQVIKAAAHGKHVLVTKPIATTIEASKAMIAACAEADVCLVVGHQSRREPGIRQLKALIAQGTLGDISLVDASCATATGLHIMPDDWRYSEVDCPGGPLLQLGIHQIDNLQYLFGKIQRVLCWTRRALAKAEIADVVTCFFRFDSGLTATLNCSYVASEARTIRVYGSTMNALYDRPIGLTLSLDAWDKGASRHRLADGYIFTEAAFTLQEEIREFASCIRDGMQPEITGEQGLSNLAVVLAAVKSAALERAVEVQEILRGGGITTLG